MGCQVPFPFWCQVPFSDARTSSTNLNKTQTGTVFVPHEIMPRTKSILQNEFPYHVSARCINKQWFTIPLEEVWRIFSRQLNYISWVFDAKIHSFVLMSNHFHMLISTPNSNLDKIMANLMRETSRAINEQSGRINQAYGSRHFRCVISNQHYFYHAYKYVYGNPVHAGLSAKCEDYPYSSLSFLLGKQTAAFQIEEDTILFGEFEDTISWLNREPQLENWITVSNAMGKAKFKLAKDYRTRLQHCLEKDLL